MISINPGENGVIRRNLKYSGGESIYLAQLSSLIVRLKHQNGGILTYTYPSTSLREGLSTSQFELEITEAVSALLAIGKINMEIELQQPAQAFLVDDEIFDIILEKNVVTVTAEPTSATHIDTADSTSAIPLAAWRASSEVLLASSGYVLASSG